MLQNQHVASLLSLQPHILYHDKCHFRINNYHHINGCHVNKSDHYHNRKGYTLGIIDYKKMQKYKMNKKHQDQVTNSMINSRVHQTSTLERRKKRKRKKVHWRGLEAFSLLMLTSIIHECV